MNLNAALAKARKLVAERAKQTNQNANKIVVCTEFNQELNGELVIILSEEVDKS